MIRISPVTVALVILVVTAGTSSRAVQTPPASSAITGTVTDGTTGGPVAGAVIVLTDDEPGSTVPPRTQVTTPTGRFALVDLPASSRYALTAIKTGWLAGGYQRTDPRGPAAPIALAVGQWLADVHVTLTRPGSISGTVMDARGEPLVGVYVRVLAQILLAGRPQWLVGPAARTDDRGVYRIAGLGPGRYVAEAPSVQATLPEGAPGPSLGGAGAGTSMADLAEAAAENRAERLVVNVGGTWHLVVGAHAVALAPAPDGAREAYPIVFAPNAPTPGDAVPIDLRVGESRAGVDISVLPVRVARVSGLVQGPPEAVGHLPLRLVPIGLEELGQGSEAATTMTEPDGHFTFLDVPSGNYVLDASHMRVDYAYVSQDQARTAVPSPVPFHAQLASSGLIQAAPPGVEYSALQDGVAAPYWGQLRVGVDGRDVDGLVVALHRPVTVSGRVGWAEGVRVSQRLPPLALEPADGRRSLGIPSLFSPLRAEAADSDTFLIGGAVAGQYFLRPKGGATVASIVWNGQDYTDRPFDTTSGADVTGVVLTLTTASSSVSGTVRDGTAPLTASAAVIAFPLQTELWSNYGLNPPRLKAVLATSDGRFRLDGLPVGDYYLVAVPAAQERAWLDPAFLARHAGAGTRLRVEKADATMSNISLSLAR